LVPQEEGSIQTELTIELKNGFKVKGYLQSIDDQMNFHLVEARLLDSGVFDSCGDSMFIRGNVIRYIHMSKNEVDTEPLLQACLRNN